MVERYGVLKSIVVGLVALAYADTSWACITDRALQPKDFAFADIVFEGDIDAAHPKIIATWYGVKFCRRRPYF